MSLWTYALLLTWIPAFAAVAADRLDWAACAREAAAANPDVLAAREALERSHAQHRAGYSPFLPQISADAGYTRGSNTLAQAGTSFTGSARDEYSYGLTARQSLFSGLRDVAGLDRAALEVEIARARLAIARASVGADLRTAFAQALFGARQIDLSNEIATRRSGNLELVELRFASGRENKGSYLRSKAYLAQARFEISQASRALAVAQRQLNRLMFRPVGGPPLEIDGDLALPKLPPRPEFGALATEVPQYTVARAEAQSAEKSVAIARSQFFPDLSVSGSIGRRGATFPPDGDRWSVGLTLALPIFPGGRNLLELQAARAEERRAKHVLDSFRDRLGVQLQEAFAELENAVDRAVVQEEFLRAAQLRSEVARTKYTTGLQSFEDWDLIENDLITTQKSRLQALHDAWTAQAAWERIAGKAGLP